ncbi:class I SAM-dependent methyltransferase [Sphingomicrobium nitratireducens]|uniref:class I SAM-dependent methyltransferase n=1 Tax=Sphingomicrobium nitratireducens TaxID=2964666 RepID=UPI00223F923D|nr:methyltransferase domain-containing protein [Sphingomicrobium nitratireducens]
MSGPFDLDLRRKRRDRAARKGSVTYLYDRALEDLVDRLDMVRRDFPRALLVGCPDPRLAERLASRVGRLDVVDPSLEMAQAACGVACDEEALDVQPGSYDLVVSLGLLADANDIAGALLRMRFALAKDGLLLGALAGGDSLPALRTSMASADAIIGRASPRIHPRIDPAGLTRLLSQAGFAMPVVDIDRVTVRFGGFDSLVADLRGMGATNTLVERSRRPLGKQALQAARNTFARLADEDGKTPETIEILYFTGWRDADG